MGGAKKPTAASRDKSSSASKDSKKSKKDKGVESGPKRAEISVRVNGNQALKIIKDSKVITVQELARQLGVKISAANTFLKGAISDGTVSVVGGYSGHYLYQDAVAANAAREQRKLETDATLKGKRTKKALNTKKEKDTSSTSAVTDKTPAAEEAAVATEATATSAMASTADNSAA